jgi:hypothetical protein
MKVFLDRKRDWFVPVVGLLLVFILSARAPVDSDMWWHLKAGEATVISGHPILVDTFSFTRGGESWINHSWLSEAGMFLLFRYGGFVALGAALALLATFSMGLVYFQSSGSPILKAFLLVFGSAVAAVVWSPRPQLVSLVMLAVASTLLYLYKWKKIDHLKWLPLVFCLWGNLHGGYALGFLLIGAMLVGEVGNTLIGNQSTYCLHWRQIRQVIMWSGISALALLLNPNGLDILKIPFQTVEVSVLQQLIQEWASPDFHELFQQPFLWLLFAILAAAGLSRRRIDLTDLVSVVLFGYLGLVARRNFGPFAIVAVPVLSRNLVAALHPADGEVALEYGELKIDAVSGSRRRPRWQRRLNLGIVGLLTIAACLKLGFVTYLPTVEAAVLSSQPEGAISWLEVNAPGGRILNEYNWGGYLEWRLPAYKVYVDGRTDLFGDSILSQWLTDMQAGDGWKEDIQRWKIDYILIDPQRPLAQAAVQNGWKVLYKDAGAVLYGK